MRTALQNKSEKSKILYYSKLVGISVLVGLLVCTLILMLFSLIISVKDVPEFVIRIMSVVAVSISAFVAGYVSAKLIKSKGMLVGLLNGVILFMLFYLTNLFLIKTEDFSALPIKVAIVLLSAGLGGVLAVNVKRKKRWFFLEMWEFLWYNLPKLYSF